MFTHSIKASTTQFAKKYEASVVNTLLRSEIAHLWPSVANNVALQKQCAATLPHLFLYCQVLNLEAGQLTLAAPNAAFASKLKQQLPQLQTALQKAGWEINAIRIKVQVNTTLTAAPAEKQCQLSATALQAFVALEKNLGQSHHNEGLLGALRTLIQRHG